jgi:hypothetical protein
MHASPVIVVGYRVLDLLPNLPSKGCVKEGNATLRRIKL